MKILITGVAGFIGSHVSEKLLYYGHEVVGIDNFDDFYPREIKEKNLQKSLANSRFTLVELDITVMNAAFRKLYKLKFDAVIHLAAKAGVRPSIENPGAYMHTNVQGTLSILELMREVKCNTLVFGSSSSVYGNNYNMPFEESAPINKPISPYAVSKICGELLTYNYHKLYGFNVINLRFFTVFGPRQRPDLAIHKFAKKISHHEPVEVYGDGTSGRDYTYIEDVVHGIVAAMIQALIRSNVYETVNLGNSNPIMLRVLIEKIEKLLDKKADIIRQPKQDGDVDLTYANIERAKIILEWAPMVSFDEGLKKFVDWYLAENENPLDANPVSDTLLDS